MDPNNAALIRSAFILLVAGMGMTFVFLIVQIFCTKASSMLSSQFSNLIPEPEVKKPAPKPAPAKKDEAETEEIIAAIAAAIHHNSR